MARRQEMPSKAEEIVDRSPGPQETAGLAWGFEPAHLAFSESGQKWGLEVQRSGC